MFTLLSTDVPDLIPPHIRTLLRQFTSSDPRTHSCARPPFMPGDVRGHQRGAERGTRPAGAVLHGREQGRGAAAGPRGRGGSGGQHPRRTRAGPGVPVRQARFQGLKYRG